MWRTSLSGNGELSSTLPQLSLLMQLRFIHILPSDLPKQSKTQSESNKTHVCNKAITIQKALYLLHLSDDLIGHIGVTLGKISTPVDRDASLIGGSHVQRTFGVESVLFERRILEVWRSLVDASGT